MKDFSFNKLFIIQSLSPDDSVGPLGKPGPILCSSVNRRITELKKKDSDFDIGGCELIAVRCYTQWNEALMSICKDCCTGCKPIVHFVCHGDKDQGIFYWDEKTNSYKSIPWQILYSNLEAINIASQNNLFVTMCVCYGFWSMKYLLSGTRIPFIGLVASPEEVYADDAIIRFTDFYLALLTKKNIEEAKLTLKDNLENICKPKNIPASDILVEYSEKLFVDAFKKEYLSRKDSAFLRKRAIEAFENEGVTVTEQLIAIYVKIYDSNIQDIYHVIRDQKFMFDIFPQERERFEFPDIID